MDCGLEGLVLDDCFKLETAGMCPIQGRMTCIIVSIRLHDEVIAGCEVFSIIL